MSLSSALLSQGTDSKGKRSLQTNTAAHLCFQHRLKAVVEKTEAQLEKAHHLAVHQASDMHDVMTICT